MNLGPQSNQGQIVNQALVTQQHHPRFEVLVFKETVELTWWQVKHLAS